MLAHKKKTLWQERARLTSPQVWAAVTPMLDVIQAEPLFLFLAQENKRSLCFQGVVTVHSDVSKTDLRAVSIVCYYYVARVQILTLMSLCSLSLLWFSPLLREVFLWVLRFSSLLKKPTLPNSDSTRNQVDEEPPSGSATSNSLYVLLNKKSRGEGAVILIIISSALFRLNKLKWQNKKIQHALKWGHLLVIKYTVQSSTHC